jgi:hypothetical protein
MEHSHLCWHTDVDILELFAANNSNKGFDLASSGCCPPFELAPTSLLIAKYKSQGPCFRGYIGDSTLDVSHFVSAVVGVESVRLESPVRGIIPYHGHGPVSRPSAMSFALLRANQR